MDALNEDDVKTFKNIFTSPNPYYDNRDDVIINFAKEIFAKYGSKQAEQWYKYIVALVNQYGYSGVLPEIKKLKDEFLQTDFLPAKTITHPNKVHTSLILNACKRLSEILLIIWKFINNNIVSTILGGGILAWIIWCVTKK